MDTICIGHQPCIMHISGTPTVALLQLTARHEQKTISNELRLIEDYAKTGFVFIGIYLDKWVEALIPWTDEAVTRNTDADIQATETLHTIIEQIIPYINNRFGQIPSIIGGYSLGALFSLWAATQCNHFAAVAAASPSVWIKNWNSHAENNKILTNYTYLSLGNREEHTRNQRMAAVGTCIRQYHETLKAQLGEEFTTLHWNSGGHFDHEDQRMADAFIWCLEKLKLR